MSIVDQVTTQQQQLEEAVAYALDIASKASDAAEVDIKKVTGIGVSTRFGNVENVEFNSDGALSISVYHQQRKGSASSSDLSHGAIQRAVEAALDIARYTSEDPYSGLGEKELMAFNAPKLDLFYPQELDADKAAEIAAKAENVALAFDKRITNTEGASYNSHYGVRVYGNSFGMMQSYCTTSHSLYCCVIASQNDAMEQDSSYTVARDTNDLFSPELVGEECARKVVARLGSRRLKTMESPIMFSPEVATGLFGHLVGAISGSNIYKKSSFLINKLGEQILPEWLTIQEKPHLAKGVASSSFDAKGILTKDFDIVKDGILQTYLLGPYSARKLNMQSTGHASGIHNWLIAGQGGDFVSMLRKMGTGLLVTDLMGQGINMVTGDYSRGAAGFWVENGEIQYPVSEITIAGNLHYMLRNIVAIGNDTERRTNIQCGSVLLEKMKIAGE